MAVFRKIFILGFYRANTGMFLFLILFLFGMMRGSDHVAIAAFFLSSYFTMLFPLVIWGMYNLNVTYFLRKSFRLKENGFISQAILLPLRTRIKVSLEVILMTCLPVILYGLFLESMTVAYHLPEKAVLIFCVMMILIIMNTFHLVYLLNRPYHSGSHSFDFIPRIRFRFPIHYIFQYIVYAVNADTIKIILAKFLSVVIIFAVTGLYRSGDYEISLVTIGALISVFFNSLLIFGMHDFYENQYRITRSLPFSWANRMITQAVILAMLMIPEWVVWFRNFSAIGIFRTLNMAGFYLAAVFMIKSFLFIRNADSDTYLKYVLYGFILLTFILLYRPPLVLLAVIPALIGIINFRIFYYRYEPVIHSSESLP